MLSERLDSTNRSVTATKNQSVGPELKRLRLEKGWSLATLAEKADVSVGMLSQIERNLANPSWKLLTKVRQALGVPVSALFSDIPLSRADPTFVRRREQHPWLDLGFYKKELLTSTTSRNLQMMVIHLPPGGSSGPTPIAYPAEKGGLVLEGELWVNVGQEEAKLSAGDSITFDSSIPHSFYNRSEEDVKLLWVITQIPAERHL